MEQLESVRRFIVTKLNERKATEGNHRTELASVLSEAVDFIDRNLSRDLEQVLGEQRELGDLMTRYETGVLPLPEDVVFQGMKFRMERLIAAQHEYLQQASNAAATLVAILQEADSELIHGQVRKWSNDLVALHETVADVIQAGRDNTRPESMPTKPSQSNSNGEFRQEVEEGLRHLNDLPRLAESKLIYRLPATLASFICTDNMNGHHVELTHLEQAQSLRGAVVASIELLRRDNGSSNGDGPQNEHYTILYEQYVLGRPTAQIQARHYMAEGMYFRRRRGAVSILTRHLEEQESRLAGVGI